MKSSSFFFLMVFFATALTITVPLTTSAALLCTNLRADLSFGDSDSYKNAQVTVLQKFLGAFGYLSAPANGNFGPSTLAAVKSFQSRNTLPSTGTVGPLTRSTIQKLSCVSQAAAVSIAITPSPTPSASPAPSISITSPASDEVLTAGSDYRISWDSSLSGTYSILLEDQYGVGAGYITDSISSGTSYVWNVGKIYSSSLQANTVLPTGTYRIRIQSLSGSTKNDRVSGLFSLKAAPISINSVLPTTIPNDNYSTGIIYGSGFDSTTRVYVDALGAYAANMLYASADGKFLAFSIPTYILPGQHPLLVSNSYSSNAITNITVTKSTR